MSNLITSIVCLTGNLTVSQPTGAIQLNLGSILTNVNSITASASTALSLNGGGGSGLSIASNGNAFFAQTLTVGTNSNPDGTTLYLYNSGGASIALDGNSTSQSTIYFTRSTSPHWSVALDTTPSTPHLVFVNYDGGGEVLVLENNNAYINLPLTVSGNIVAQGADNNNLIVSTNTGANSASIRIQANNAGNYLVAAGAVPLYLLTNGTTALTIDASQNATFAGSVTINSTTSSSSTTTGALIVAGGLGVGSSGQNSYFGGDVFITNGNPYLTLTNNSTGPGRVVLYSDSMTHETIMGIEQSGGGGLFVGSSSYAAVFGAAGTNDVAQIAANNTVVATFTSTGLNSCAIGATTASIGKFTTLTASSSIKFSSFSAGTLVSDGSGNITVSSSVGNGITVNNRAALRALSPIPAAGTVITELGYYWPGDGGGGQWVVVTSDTTTIDDDGTRVIPGATPAQLVTTISGGEVTAISVASGPSGVTYPGSGYSGSSISIIFLSGTRSGGSIATATANISGGSISSVTVNSAGGGYLSPPYAIAPLVASGTSFKRVDSVYYNPTSGATNENLNIVNVCWFGANIGQPSTYPGYDGDAGWGIIRAFNSLFGANGSYGGNASGGGLYFPAAFYGIQHMVQLDCGNNNISIFGDGPESILNCAFPNTLNLTTNYCMLQILNPNYSYIGKFSIDARSIAAGITQVYASTILRVSGGAYTMSDIFVNTGITNTANGMPGGSIWIEGSSQATVSHINATASIYGTAMYVGGSDSNSMPGTQNEASLILHDCWLSQGLLQSGPWENISSPRPTLWIEQCDSSYFWNLVVDSGGPAQMWPNSTITGTGSYFTITTGGASPVAHNLNIGDYILIGGASHSAYNAYFRVTAIPSTTEIRVTSTIDQNESSVTVSTLFAGILVGGGINPAGGGANESMMSNIFINEGGTTMTGSVGIFFCARAGTTGLAWVSGGTYTVGNTVSSSAIIYICIENVSGSSTPPGSDGTHWSPAIYGIGGWNISNIYSDYGDGSIFMHGYPTGDPTISAMQLTSIRANGGPRSVFGGIRLEIGQTVTIENYYGLCATTTPPSGYPSFSGPFAAIVLCDGGSANADMVHGIQDITINGGQLQNIAGSYNASTVSYNSVGLIVDGTRGGWGNGNANQNIKAAGTLIDRVSSNSIPLQLLNSAARTVSGITNIDVDFWEGDFASVYSASGGDTFNSGSGAYVSTFDTVTQNDDGMYSSGAKDRLTVTQNFDRVIVTAWVTLTAPPGAAAYLQIVHNGSIIATTCYGYGASCSLTTPPVAVAITDYFQVFVTQDSGTTLYSYGGAGYTGMSMQVVK